MKKYFLTLLVIFCIIELKAEVRHIKTSDSVDLYITIKGKGTPCLYIHGGPGSGSYWIEKFMGDTLEQHFQMIYLDQRGCCRSTSPKDNNYSMERMVKDFEEVRTALNIEKWIIMGHSFGGILQVGYALRHPDVIKGMVIINGTLNWKESFETGFCPYACSVLGIADKAPCTNDSVLFIDRFGSLIGQLNQKNLMWKMGYSSYENFEKMGATFSEIPAWNWGSEEYIVYTSDYWENFKKYTPDLKMPVLFFYGKTDWSIGPEHYKGVNFPEMILWSSDVGHMPFLENKEDLITAINTFQKKYKF